MSETLEQHMRREAHSDALHKLNAYTGDVVELLDERDAIISGLCQEAETKRAEVYAQAAEIERLREALRTIEIDATSLESCMNIAREALQPQEAAPAINPETPCACGSTTFVYLQSGKRHCVVCQK